MMRRMMILGASATLTVATALSHIGLAARAPLRLSADEGDPGFEAWARMTLEEKGRIRTYLDGREVRHVNTSCEGDPGFVRHALEDVEGHIYTVVDAHGETVFAEETVWGHVRIDLG